MSRVRFGSAAAVTARAPSPIIWNDCPVDDIASDPAKGQHLFDDLHRSIVSGTTLVAGQPEGWTSYNDANDATDVAVQADNDGVLFLQHRGTDADVVAITTGDNVCGRFKTPTAGDAQRGLWFEARIKVVTITNSDQGAFIGLSQPGEAKVSGGGMTAGGAGMSDIDHVGFAQLSGDCDDLILVYNEATSGTAQTSTGVITLVADTWVRIGFKVVTKGQGTYLQWYKDGVYLGAAYDVNLTNANANWPGATDMDLLLSTVGESGVANADGIYVDWVRCAEVYA